jgi:hypothetical protein
MESLVEGDLVALLRARGIAITDTTTRIKGQGADGGNYEFDIIAQAVRICSTQLSHCSSVARPACA